MSWLREAYRHLLYLPPAGSTLADKVDDMHIVIITTTMGVGLVIGVVTLSFLVRYRRRGAPGLTERRAAPVWLEVLFIGGTFSTFVIWGAVGFVDYQWAHQAPPGALDVFVMGKQWMWKFAYSDGASEVGLLRVPVGRPVRLLITSRDVIHSFYVPAFRLKQDAVPGRYTEIWFEATRVGRFPVYCAEYCGLDHSQMRAEVEVMGAAEFEQWRRGEGGAQLADARRPGPMAEQGKRVAAEKGCLKCHTLDGTAHIGPTWVGLWGRVVPLEGGGQVLADEEYLTQSMMEPKAKVVLGFNPVMPSFHGLLEPADVAALLELIKSLRTEAPPPNEEPVYVPRH
jgi:cytochrome c oxidase subunit 2